tara:strand:- start:413 stop:916 length:504 start_codon:yes stop_codon:yes gene_type:complete
MLLSQLTNGQSTSLLFTLYPTFNFSDPLSYVRIWSHIIGHGSWQHLIGNFSMILLLGPLLEEKYGSGPLLIMMLITAVITGILNTAFFTSGLLGASGIVFMFILLSSFSGIREGEIPLTFVMIAVLYFGQELVLSLRDDNVSQFGHILGGLTGSLFGYHSSPGSKDN